MSDEIRIAIFVDAENLTNWLKEDGPESLLEELAGTGAVVVRRAYGKWTNPTLAAHQAVLNRLGFELVHCYHPVSGKNSSDIRMAVDVMEYLWRVNRIDWFVLATGDSDFSPLFQRLREAGKGVIGVGPRSALSDAVKSSCSRFVYTESRSQHPLLRQEQEEARRAALDDALDLLERTIRSFDGPVHCSLLKNRMLDFDSGFDERNLGFHSFLDFLRQSETVKLTNRETSWFVSLDLSNVPVSERAETLSEIHALPRVTKPLEEMYAVGLRRKKWRSLPKQSLFSMYQLACEIEGPYTRMMLVEAMRERAEASATITEIRKALAIFMKAKLFYVSGEDENGGDDSAWELVKLNEDRFWDAIDFAMICRIVGYCVEANLAIKPNSVMKLVMGPPEPERIESLLEDARAFNSERLVPFADERPSFHLKSHNQQVERVVFDTPHNVDTLQKVRVEAIKK